MRPKMSYQIRRLLKSARAVATKIPPDITDLFLAHRVTSNATVRLAFSQLHYCCAIVHWQAWFGWLKKTTTIKMLFKINKATEPHLVSGLTSRAHCEVPSNYPWLCWWCFESLKLLLPGSSGLWWYGRWAWLFFGICTRIGNTYTFYGCLWGLCGFSQREPEDFLKIKKKNQFKTVLSSILLPFCENLDGHKVHG